MEFIYGLIDPTMVGHWAEQLFGHQFTQMTLAFLAASWLHSGRVKKEIKIAFISLTAAIDNVANKVTNELSGIKTEIHDIRGRVEKLEGDTK